MAAAAASAIAAAAVAGEVFNDTGGNRFGSKAEFFSQLLVRSGCTESIQTDSQTFAADKTVPAEGTRRFDGNTDVAFRRPVRVAMRIGATPSATVRRNSRSQDATSVRSRRS